MAGKENEVSDNLVTIAFPQETVELVLAGAADIINEEYPFIEQTSMSLAGLQQRLMLKRQSDTDDKGREGMSRGAGFALAHRALRGAAQDAGRVLPPMNDELVRNYEAYVRRVPAVLEKDFLRDYADHEGVINLVEGERRGKKGLRNDNSREGAMFMFNLYGRLANPNRGAVLIPVREDRFNVPRPRQGPLTSRRRQRYKR
jgi:hypothetical protein